MFWPDSILFITEVVGSPLILFHQPQEAEGMTVFSQAWRVLLPKVISLGTDRSNVFLETWWELCILSRTVTFLDLERTTAKSADQPIHLRSEKTGSQSCQNPSVFLLPHRTEVFRAHLEEERSVVYSHCCFPQKKHLWENGTQPFPCCLIA